MLDFYAGNHSRLYPGRRMSKAEFTYELSDHLPVWVEINTDNDAELMEQSLNRRGR